MGTDSSESWIVFSNRNCIFDLEVSELYFSRRWNRITVSDFDVSLYEADRFLMAIQTVFIKGVEKFSEAVSFSINYLIASLMEREVCNRFALRIFFVTDSH